MSVTGTVSINYNATYITSDQKITVAPDVIENDSKYYISGFEYQILKNNSSVINAPKKNLSLKPIVFDQSFFVDISGISLTTNETLKAIIKFYEKPRDGGPELTYVFNSNIVTYNPNIQATNYIKISRRKRNVSQIQNVQKNNSEHLIAPVPDVLSDDGGILRIHKDYGPYWSKIVGGFDINYTYRLYYTHGYTLGGYKGGVAYTSVYKTIHNQGSNSVTSFVGYEMKGRNAYTGGTWGDTNAYVYSVSSDSANTGGIPSNTKKVAKFNMATETGSALIESASSHYRPSVLNNFGLFGYIISNGIIDEQDLITDAFSVFGSGVGNTGVNCSSGKEAGYLYAGGDIIRFDFATKSASTLGISEPSGPTCNSCVPTKRFYHYHTFDAWGLSLTKFDEVSNSKVSGEELSKPHGFFEESWQMGEENAFSVGVYGGASGGQNRDVYYIDLDSSTMAFRGVAPGPGSGATAAGVDGLSTGANVSAAGSLYSSMFPNYSLVHYSLV